MSTLETVTIDGNQAAATIAYQTNEVIAIYPITPASPMGEWADEWASRQQLNSWGTVPSIIEMQSEGGAAGAIHGALQAGTLTTTFTASQGLLLMIPNMFKIAGELSPTVFHVAARSIAAQALSIFGDHSDVMTARSTGFAFLCSNSPQEVMDMALIAQAVTLQSQIPIIHFFDGFRTSHEVSKITSIDSEVIKQLIKPEYIAKHRKRALNPEHPVIRGTSQNPDVFFQARESVNKYYDAMPEIVQNVMNEFAQLTGRQYKLFDYVGAEDAERVIVLMGSGAETVHETVEFLCKQGEKVGLLKVRLFRPLDSDALLNVLPKSVHKIAVLDRTKEPGSGGEPLYKDVVSVFAQHIAEEGSHFSEMPKVIGGRFGLSSKEFTPGMVKSVFDQLIKERPKNNFTIGIHDDVTNSSLDWDESFRTDAHETAFQAVFYGLGSDGTVSANKNSIKIIGECTDKYVQGYFVYDSKKSGAVTVSHLRFDDKPIHSTYLIGNGDANFVACHQPVFMERYPMLDKAADNAVFLLNTAVEANNVWQTLPQAMQQQILDKHIQFYVIDAYKVAEQTGMDKRINTIMQTCFFSISGVLPKEQAIKSIKQAVEKTYGRKGQRLIDLNFNAIDKTLGNLVKVELPVQVSQTSEFEKSHEDTSEYVPEFVHNITKEIIAGRGDALPVSLFPSDGSYPLGTAAYEKRNIGLEIPVLDGALCTQCGKCPLVCPHGVIRSKVYEASIVDVAPDTFKSMPVKGKDFPENHLMSYQVSPEDCTGCGLCVDVCPIHDKTNVSHKALNMVPYTNVLRQQEKDNWEFFVGIPDYDRTLLKTNTIKGAMLLQPLFEFSGACEGCGETPYIKLASQLFGDRMLVANATGCSSIYGGNLPTTPWAKNAHGRGPAWSNSLFEDNAEFGLGMRLSIDKQKEYATELITQLKSELGEFLVDEILHSDQSTEKGIEQQRDRLHKVREKLSSNNSFASQELLSVLDALSRKSVWIIGGDGWAYDIGYGGLDHVLASGRDVNILVLDTEVYSNTGGQTSKATPRGAVAKFSAGGKATPKKDLALLAMDYENVYVAHVAYGAKDIQTIHAFNEAEAYKGPSLIIAYSPCIAHGVDLKNNHQQQHLAVDSGHWPLFRYNPENAKKGINPLHLDSKPPSIPYRDFIDTEIRFNMLWRTHPEVAEDLLKQSQQDVLHRYHFYEQLANLSWDEIDSSQPPHRKLASAMKSQKDKAEMEDLAKNATEGK